MEKSKLGLPIPVMGALTYLVFLFGGYTPGLLVVGYVLLCEEHNGLKKAAITAVLTAVAISVANLLIGLLPDIAEVFRSLSAMFGGYTETEDLNALTGFLYAILALVKTVAFVSLAIFEFKGKPLTVSFVDKLMN